MPSRPHRFFGGVQGNKGTRKVEYVTESNEYVTKLLYLKKIIIKLVWTGK